MNNSSAKSLIINFIYSSSYQILRIVLPLVTLPYVSRVMGADSLGVYSYTSSVATYFAMLAFLGFENYGNRLIASKRQSQDELNYSFTSAYLFQLFSSALALLLYVIYLLVFCKSNKEVAFFQIFYVLAEVVNVSWLYYGLEKIKKITTISMAVRIISAVLIFALVHSPADVTKYTVICSGSILLSMVLSWIGIHHYVRFVPVKIADIFSHAKECVLLFFPVLVISIYRTMDKIMLGHMATMSQVAIYSNADKIVELPYGIIAALGGVMLPRMTYLVSTGQINKSNKYIEISLEFMLCASCGIAFGLMAIANVFSPVFFGKEFVSCGNLIILISPMILVRACANVVRTQYLLPNHRDRDYITSIVIGVFINLTVNALLIPHLASFGAAIGTLMTEVFVAGYQIYVCRKDIPVLKYTFQNWPFLLAGLFMFVPVFLFGKVHGATVTTLLLQVGIGVLIYCGLAGIYIWFCRREYRSLLHLKR